MKSVEELNKIREKELNKIALRHEKGENLEKIHVLVCGGTGCHSSQGDEIRRLLHEKVVEKKLENKVEVVLTGCFGLCEAGPNIVIYP
ncbi:(2Fe-2S) ferredoxin domain-containing protein, partial [Anaerosalibacter bizertensis]|nr:(2Fe-2S) ferredoxin domain-containing protein [Anaerosalibacter bizertensis]